MSINRAEIKVKIEQELLTVETDIEALKELTRPIAPENAIGRISRMDAINNKSINDASLRQSEEKKKKLQIALGKVDHPDFGICIRCKQPIPIGRIMLMPHAQKCVKCS
jgi:DnaK suppressor protein